MHGANRGEGFSSRGFEGGIQRGFSADSPHKSAGQREGDAWRAPDTWISGNCTRVKPKVIAETDDFFESTLDIC